MYVMYESSIAHHGIKGQRWGVRRYQNYDGTLTSSGRKRVAKEYDKLNAKVEKKWNRNARSNYVDAYNKAASEFDTNKFNSDYEKKHGADSFGTQKYYNDYYSAFNKVIDRNYNRALHSFLEKDNDARLGRELCRAYDMTSWHQMARDNTEAIEKLRKMFD